MTLIKEILLRLIHIEKRNIAREKLVQKSNNRIQSIFTCGRKNNIRLVIPKHSFGKGKYFNSMVDNKHPKLPKNVTIDK